MSVIVLDSKDYGKIANTLIETHQSRRIFSQGERLVMERDSEVLKITPYDYNVQNMVWFVNRLYVSNQIAYYMTYEFKEKKPMQIFELDEVDLQNHMPIGDKQLLIKLKDVRCNLYDNAGHAYVDAKDLERLNKMINYLAEKIALSDY